MKPFLEELSRVADTNVHVYPNAGLPNPLSETGYDETPEHTGSAVAGFAKAGLSTWSVVAAAQHPSTLPLWSKKFRHSHHVPSLPLPLPSDLAVLKHSILSRVKRPS